MNGPQHYREAERLLALARESKDTTFEGHNPEADRLIAEAGVHAQLAKVALDAVCAPICESSADTSGHPSQEYYEEWFGVVEIGTEDGAR